MRFFDWLRPYWRKFRIWQKAYFKKYHVWKLIILAIMTLGLVMSTYLFILAKSSNVGMLKTSMQTQTIIYDEVNQSAGSLFNSRGSFVELNQINPYVVKAAVATEDRSFYTNRGFDIRGLARAAVGLVLNRGATTAGGGSTISQQLAKNAFLTLDQTFDRKARELFLAIELNRVYSKDEIMTMYLNDTFMGHGVWGVQDAARRYFGVDAGQLTLGQAATIVGLMNGPSIFNPIDFPENAMARRNIVLQNMVTVGDITQQQADEQKAINIATQLNDTFVRNTDDYRFPSFFDAVISEIEQKTNLTEQDILTGGYKIYTTLNQASQTAMQNTYANNAFFPQSEVDGEFAQSASIAINPQTGAVQAVVGNRGDTRDHQFRRFNFATQGMRSPGSSIKPIVPFASAVEDGMTPDTILEDKPQSFYPEAQNYSRTYTGSVPMYQALAESLNLPAVYLLNKIGIQRGFDEGTKFGLPLVDADKYYGLALGGLKNGVTPLQMAQAYTAFANNGVKSEAYFVRKIVDSKGRVIYEAKPSTTRVMSNNTAKTLSAMMLGVMSNGTGVNANPAGYIMAGKTGTTETSWDPTLTNDQWVIAYTPDVVITTWLGFEVPSQEKGHFMVGTSTNQASAIFNSIASGILPTTAGKTWQQLYPGIINSFWTNGQITPSEEESTGNFNVNADDLRQQAADALDNARQNAQGLLDGAGRAINDIRDAFGIIRQRYFGN
jgi:penicillin-binding protein 2A